MLCWWKRHLRGLDVIGTTAIWRQWTIVWQNTHVCALMATGQMQLHFDDCKFHPQQFIHIPGQPHYTRPSLQFGTGATTELTNIKMCKIKGYAAYSISLPTEVWLATYTTIEVFIDWSSTTNQRFLNKILATNRNVAGPYYSRPLTRTVRLFLPNGS